MTTAYACDPVDMLMSVAITVNANVFAVLGVPASWPLTAFKLKPVGRAPVNDQVQSVHPVAVRVWLYGALTVQLGSAGGLIWIAP